MEFIHNLGKTGEIINAVLLTHFHPDGGKGRYYIPGTGYYHSGIQNPLFMRLVMSDFKRWKAMPGTCDTAYKKILAKNEKTC